MKSITVSKFFASLFLLLSPLAVGQNPGIPLFSPIHSDAVDNVKISDGSFLISFPVRSKSALLPFSYSLQLNINVRLMSPVSISSFTYGPTPGSFSAVVDNKTSNGLGGYLGYTNSFLQQCPNQPGVYTTVLKDYVYTDIRGSTHPIGDGIQGIYVDTLGCLGPGYSNYSYRSKDGLYYGTVNTSGNEVSVVNTAGESVLSGISDPNGNSVTRSTVVNGNTTTTTWSDSTGAVPMTETVVTTGTPPHQVTDAHVWTDENGSVQSYVINYSQYVQKTNFQCAHATDIPATTAYLPSSITTPDGTVGLFYEATPGTPADITGRISKITFPSGASTQYAYSGGVGNSGLFCDSSVTTTDGMRVPVLTRTLTDVTGKVRIWKYDTSTIANATIVTDPNGNDSVHTFLLTTQGWRSPSEYLAKSYQGSRTSGTLLKTTTTCYNGATNCSASVVTGKVTTEDIYITIPGMTQYLSEHDGYDQYSNLSTQKKYDCGSVLVSDNEKAYGTYSGGSCAAVSAYILNKVCTIATTDSAGHIAAQSRYTYNSTGNLTSSSQWVSGSTWLTKTITPNTNGTPATSTDVNGTPTSYTYGACNGSYPTLVSSGGLSTSITWNCDGGVMLSRTDANNQPTTFDYRDSGSGIADPYWRLKSITDPLGNITKGVYTPTTVEQSLVFNSSSSTVDTLTSSDGFGRARLTQKRQAPASSTFDTVTVVYDGNGNASSTSMPCAAAAGVSCPAAPATIQTYDGLKRPLVTTDGGNGTITRSYPKNDTLAVLGPAPAGEHSKSRQYEYDGLGRLKSVCEVLTSGGTSCGQNIAASGYKTSYAYSVPATGGSQVLVTQGSQVRTYVRDGLAA